MACYKGPLYYYFIYYICPLQRTYQPKELKLWGSSHDLTNLYTRDHMIRLSSHDLTNLYTRDHMIRLSSHDLTNLYIRGHMIRLSSHDLTNLYTRVHMIRLSSHDLTNLYIRDATSSHCFLPLSLLLCSLLGLLLLGYLLLRLLRSVLIHLTDLTHLGGLRSGDGSSGQRRVGPLPAGIEKWKKSAGSLIK